MDLKHFRLIKAIAEEGSIANSSNKLFLTPSAISHQLRDLEEQLGFKVFFRTRNKWVLTEEGQELHQLSVDLLNKIDKGFDRINLIQKGVMGNIKIETECYSFYMGLPSFIQKMAILYPQIDVDLVIDAAHQPVPKLLSNDIDFAIVTSKPSSPLLSSISLPEDEVYCMMCKGNSLAEKDYLEANDFTAVHLIIHSYPLESVAVFKHFLTPNKTSPKKTTAIPFLSVALEMIEANMGVMCLPKWALSAFKLSDELVYKKISKNGMKRRQYLVYRTEDKAKKYIHDFIENFKETFLNQKK